MNFYTAQNARSDSDIAIKKRKEMAEEKLKSLLPMVLNKIKDRVNQGHDSFILRLENPEAMMLKDRNYKNSLSHGHVVKLSWESFHIAACFPRSGTSYCLTLGSMLMQRLREQGYEVKFSGTHITIDWSFPSDAPETEPEP